MRDLPLPTFPISNLSAPAAPRRSLHPRESKILVAGFDANRFDVVWARDEDDVRQAQQLRHLVFAEEMGARLMLPHGAPPGHDIDLFDPFCEHLLVRAATADGEPGPVIGTYRVLTPAQAQRVGGTYSDTEFDLTRLRALRSRMVELGRSCVHADHRQGGVILALWGALAAFMQRNKLDTMIGCASIPMQHDGIPGGHAAASIWRQLSASHMADIRHQVQPRLPLPVDRLDTTLDVEAPALIRGYLRLGAKLLGAPAWDPDFNAADLPMLMRIEDMPARYRRHFLGHPLRHVAVTQMS